MAAAVAGVDIGVGSIRAPSRVVSCATGRSAGGAGASAAAPRCRVGTAASCPGDVPRQHGRQRQCSRAVAPYPVGLIQDQSRAPQRGQGVDGAGGSGGRRTARGPVTRVFVTGVAVATAGMAPV
jgi:hypothetical protein